MPTVLRRGAFRVVIFLPPREHMPPHVHVWSADGEAVIELPHAGAPAVLRSVFGMRTLDAARARRLVDDEAEFLLHCWNTLHA